MTAVTLTAVLVGGNSAGDSDPRASTCRVRFATAPRIRAGLSFGAGIGGLVVIEVALAMVLLFGST